MIENKIFGFLFFLISFVIAQQRTFTLENYCSNTIWFTLTSGAAPTVSGSGTCPGVACVQGSTCNTNNGICFWNNPTPQSGKYRIDVNSTNSITFPFYNNGQDIVWSGNIGACLSGTCSDSSSICDSQGCGVINGAPMTKAEYTLSKAGSDFYDLEVINGFNLPMAIYPSTGGNANNPYTCGSPGAPKPVTSTGASSWDLTPPNMYYNWVIAGGATCSSNSNCASGVCGLSMNPGQSQLLQLTCGELVGYWTPDQVCGVQSNFGSPFNCQQASTSNPGLTLTNLYACNGGIGSCYQNGASNTCCGCENWSQAGISVPSITQTCTNQNSEWIEYVEPTLVWLKRGAPTVYTYPYDDMSSTFTCTSGGSTNTENYNIVWCPNNSAKYSDPLTTTGQGSTTGQSGSGESTTSQSSTTESQQQENLITSDSFSLNPSFLLFFLSFVLF